MLEIFGFIVLVLMNSGFTFLNFLNVCMGGVDLGPLFTSWGSPWTKAFGAGLIFINCVFWVKLYDMSPFTVTLVN